MRDERRGESGNIARHPLTVLVTNTLLPSYIGGEPCTYDNIIQKYVVL